MPVSDCPFEVHLQSFWINAQKWVINFRLRLMPRSALLLWLRPSTPASPSTGCGTFPVSTSSPTEQGGSVRRPSPQSQAKVEHGLLFFRLRGSTRASPSQACARALQTILVASTHTTRASPASVQTATGILPGLITSSALVRLLKPGRQLRSSPAPHRSDGSLSTAWSLLLDSRAVEEGLWLGRPPRLRALICTGSPSSLCCRRGGAT